MLALRFALRYLFSRKSHSVINIIAGVSVFAIAMPVAAMIILLSVFNGFEGLVRSMSSTFDADLTIRAREGVSFPVERIDTTALSRLEGVEALGWVVEQEALIRRGDRQLAARVRGVEPGYTRFLPIDRAITAGHGLLQREDREYALLGQSMAWQLGIRHLQEEEPIEINALKRNTFSTLLPLEGYTRQRVIPGGVFQLDAESENNYLLTSLRLARRLFDREGEATALLLRLANPEQTESLRDRIATMVGEEFEVRTRYELRPTFYDMMTYEKWGIFFISLLVLLIASFSVVGALTMLIIEKRDERITLRALGGDAGFIRRIFLGEGLLIGAIGCSIGVVLGVGLTLLQQHLGLIRMPVESFILNAYPVELRGGDLLATLLIFALIVGGISLLTVHSLIPKRSLTHL